MADERSSRKEIPTLLVVLAACAVLFTAGATLGDVAVGETVEGGTIPGTAVFRELRGEIGQWSVWDIALNDAELAPRFLDVFLRGTACACLGGLGLLLIGSIGIFRPRFGKAIEVAQVGAWIMIASMVFLAAVLWQEPSESITTLRANEYSMEWGIAYIIGGAMVSLLLLSLVQRLKISDA